MGWMDEAMETLRPWIGRVRTVEDDIGMMAVRRVAATFDVDPDSIKRGQELPPHWFTVFFAETVRQGEVLVEQRADLLVEHAEDAEVGAVAVQREELLAQAVVVDH